MRDSCIGCEHYEPVGEGYGLCVMDAIPVSVMADYEPTKNHLRCQIGETNNNDSYGEMAYQNDEKSPQQMEREGWCNDCTENLYNCTRNNHCEGYRRYNEDTN